MHPPPLDFIKINSDIAVRQGRGIGLGTVIRDDSGREDASFASDIAEALACRMGVHLALSKSLQKVCIESDCLTLIHQLFSGHHDQF